MTEDDVSNSEEQLSQLRHEDTAELAANLAMYAPPPFKDPLDSSTTAELALEKTPVFDMVVRSRGYNPLKDQWSGATRIAEIEHAEMVLRLEEKEVRRRRQPKKKTRRERKQGNRS